MFKNNEKRTLAFKKFKKEEYYINIEGNQYWCNNLSFKEIYYSKKDNLSSSNFSNLNFITMIVNNKNEQKNYSSNKISKKNNFSQKLKNVNNAKNEPMNIVFKNNILKISKLENSIIKNKNNSKEKKTLNNTISSNAKGLNKIRTKTLTELLNQNFRVVKSRNFMEQYGNNKNRIFNYNEYNTERNKNINIIKTNKLEKANSKENFNNDSLISKFIAKRTKTNNNIENAKFQNQIYNYKDKKNEIPFQKQNYYNKNNNIFNNYNNNQKNNEQKKSKSKENDKPISINYQNYSKEERRINNVEKLIGKMDVYMKKLDGYVDSQKKMEEKMDKYIASQQTMNDNLFKLLKKLSGDENKQENESEKNMDKNSKKNIPINKKNK